jgi:energy-coupling factor transport system substrate-specific component
MTATLPSTATLAAAALSPPAAPASAGATARLASESAAYRSFEANADWRLNTPFVVVRESAQITQATADPVLPALIALALAGLFGAIRVIRRTGLRMAVHTANPTPIGRVLAAPIASLRPSRGLTPRGSTTAAGRSMVGARHSGLLSLAVYGLTAGIGLLALLQPFLAAAVGSASTGANPANAPLLVTVLIALCFLALLFEVQGQAVSAKTIALLGVLVAINAVLRFIEVSIPGPGGFTPVFFLIVLTGYVFGGRFGFLMGALTLLVSSLITGGVGPWLPGQMFTAGWMGLIAPLARPLVRLVGGRPHSKAEVAVLAGYAGLCGLFYGVVINLWFWPFMTGPADQYWQAGVGLAATVQRYAVYYVATSLLWDVFAVAGNMLLVAVFGAATLRALRRFHQRFDFEFFPDGVVADAMTSDDVPHKQPSVSRPAQTLPVVALSEG